MHYVMPRDMLNAFDTLVIQAISTHAVQADEYTRRRIKSPDTVEHRIRVGDKVLTIMLTAEYAEGVMETK